MPNRCSSWKRINSLKCNIMYLKIKLSRNSVPRPIYLSPLAEKVRTCPFVDNLNSRENKTEGADRERESIIGIRIGFKCKGIIKRIMDVNGVNVRKLTHSLKHYQQRHNWDCGLSCVLMTLQEAQREQILQDLANIIDEEGFEQSTWTIDLCYLLKR